MSSPEKRPWIFKLLDVLTALRSENGCPWDKEQTHATIKRFLVEECAELLDAIDDGDDDHIREELGDVLLHIVFHAKIAEEENRFTFDDVARVITEKMIRRHPHVFADAQADNPDEVLEIWREIKKNEKPPEHSESILDRVPRSMPALARADELQKRAAKVGFDWSEPSQIIEKIEEELNELKSAVESGDDTSIDEEIGDILFAAANLARFRKRDTSEEILAKANGKFIRRFQHIERSILAKGETLENTSIEEMERLWNEAKKKRISEDIRLK
ncbi:MAG: nucleoside triphosphate pyrophosphohydrolase [Kiritimatiellaeota bacterium]|nr:nucleoside triphosphate pyrophosphohydrolase [Kiritimatiellota bacterium]